MRVVIAKEIGFCSGVERAVNLVKSSLKKGERLSSLGPLIHNERVISRLEKEGLKVVKNLSEIREGKVVIRSHGISPSLLSKIKERRLPLIDTTCPFVKRVQRKVVDLKKRGYFIIICGDPLHPEVKGLKGFAKESILISPESIKIPALRERKIAVISQTTLGLERYRKAVFHLLSSARFSEISIFNTICPLFQSRKEEAENLAKKVDILLVLGSKESSNTGELFNSCQKILPLSFRIDGKEDLKKQWFKGRKIIGIVSGTSTPMETIREVVNLLERRD